MNRTTTLLRGSIFLASAAGLLMGPQLLASVQAERTLAAVYRSNLAEAVSLPPLEVERTLTLRRGQSLSDALKHTGFAPAQVQAMTKATEASRQPVGRTTEVLLTYKEEAPYQVAEAEVVFRPVPEKEVTVQLQGTQATAQALAKPLTEHKAVAVGRIGHSLWADATRAGMSPQQVKQFMDLFAWDIDYTRDIQPGDSFRVQFEETRNDLGQRVRTGRILAASFTVGNKTAQAYWWPGTNEYLNEKGESKRKLLLRTPLEVYRISSNYGMRKHPVLGYSKMHRGTDFAAPIGTPVKASGDGVIVEIGPKGAYGNFILIKHTDKFSTAYAHLHRFAKGLKRGSRVQQGQIIAQVGNTGRSTGPHLHYEVRLKGQQVDAMRTDLPTSNPLPRKDLARFKAMVNEAKTAWHKAEGMAVASRE